MYNVSFMNLATFNKHLYKSSYLQAKRTTQNERNDKSKKEN
jgi:hypothetical protein